MKKTGGKKSRGTVPLRYGDLRFRASAILTIFGANVTGSRPAYSLTSEDCQFLGGCPLEMALRQQMASKVPQRKIQKKDRVPPPQCCF
jgi:hypothetical protein